MDREKDWAMDRLAANSLLAHLHMEATDDRLDMVAQHFAGHRRTAMEWAAKQVHGHMIGKLEASSAQYFTHRSADWSEGFRAAEHQVATTLPRDMLDLPPDSGRSKGQILRSLLRDARARKAASRLA